MRVPFGLWWKRLFGRRAPAGKPPAPPGRPALEALEDRNLLSTATAPVLLWARGPGGIGLVLRLDAAARPVVELRQALEAARGFTLLPALADGGATGAAPRLFWVGVGEGDGTFLNLPADHDGTLEIVLSQVSAGFRLTLKLPQPAAGQLVALRVTDHDGDGRADLVAWSRSGTSGPLSAQVYFGTIDGSFEARGGPLVWCLAEPIIVPERPAPADPAGTSPPRADDVLPGHAELRAALSPKEACGEQPGGAPNTAAAEAAPAAAPAAAATLPAAPAAEGGPPGAATAHQPATAPPPPGRAASGAARNTNGASAGGTTAAAPDPAFLLEAALYHEMTPGGLANPTEAPADGAAQPGGAAPASLVPPGSGAPSADGPGTPPPAPIPPSMPSESRSPQPGAVDAVLAGAEALTLHDGAGAEVLTAGRHRPAADDLTLHDAPSSPAGPAGPTVPSALAGLGQILAQAIYLGSLRRLTGATGADAGQVADLSEPGLVVADLVRRSAEALTGLVKEFYRTFLGRLPGDGEEQGWVQMLLGGATEEEVLSNLLCTAEFVGRAAAGTAGTPDERYVQSLYALLLHRPATEAELTAWLGALPALGRAGIASFLVRSVEFRTLQIASFHQVLAGRPATEAEVADWANSPFDLLTIRKFLAMQAEALAPAP